MCRVSAAICSATIFPLGFLALLWIPDVVIITNPPYPLVPYPHTYIALYFSYAKVTCNTHTKKQEIVSIPLTLVPSLA